MSSRKPNNGNHESQRLKKLTLTEKKLAELLHKIDQEINRTDVEWMHLRNIVQTSKAQSISDISSKVTSPLKAEMKRQLDDEAVNNIQLDLSLGHPNNVMDEEEESD